MNTEAWTYLLIGFAMGFGVGYVFQMIRDWMTEWR